MMLRQPLWLLLLLPAVALFAFSLLRRTPVRLSPMSRMKNAGRTWRIRLWWLPETLTLAIFTVLVFLIAGPQRPLDPGKDTAQGLSIVIAFDRSSSMSAIIPYGGDKIRRIDGVKQVTRDFLARRENDQFALVSFARYPETNMPLTANKSILIDFLGLIDVPTNQDEDGTAIGDALILAAAHLAPAETSGVSTPDPTGTKKSPGVIILLTDGQNNRGEKTPSDAADIAARAGATVYTIGLGGDGYVMQDTAFGPQPVGVPVTIDEDTLQAIAGKTGGKYYRANGVGDLAGFYEDIARRETAKYERLAEQKTELNLGAGLWALLALLFASVLTRYFLLRRRDS